MKPILPLLKSPRIILLVVVLLFALWAISPNPFAKGVAIKSVVKNSAAFEAGIEMPKPNAKPTSLERIVSINGQPITTINDYYAFMKTVTPNQTLYIETNKRPDGYILVTRTAYKITVLDELEEKIVQERMRVNETINGTTISIEKLVNKTVYVNKTIAEPIGLEPIGLFVEDAPKTNIRLGLDLQGGTRVLLEPEYPLSEEEMETIRTSMEQRLNVYGLSNIIPRIIYDRPKALGGTPKYIAVEIAGANIQEVRDLLAKQGKFEAKIGDQVVFTGGGDVKFVCRSPECSGIDPRNPPRRLDDGNYASGFWFTVTLSQEAAKRQALATANLAVVTIDQYGNPIPPDQQYLEKPIELYLDGELIDTLNIGRGLKGNAITNIQISGSAIGSTRDQSMYQALDQMKKLQTVMITGSLQVKMNIVKADNISPVLGKEFAKNALKVGMLAILIVVLSVFLIYRKIKISIPMIITMLSEVVLLLGLASLLRWDLDLAAIAGIIIAVGTGVDDQIIIADEILQGEKQTLVLTWKERIKNAFFIVLVAYFATVVAMVPLLFAGAGLLKGFALTTIAGVTFGVFVTRQAYAAMVEHTLKE
ncbi:MAG: hypothetical protein QW594_01820 [Candidatus Woesearchaeota archaeon]